MTELLEAVEVETGRDPHWSVVWMHGLGADGHDFEPIVGELRLPEPVRFVFPHAPVRPVTINGGVPMRAWYDIVSLEPEGRADETGILASAELIEKRLELEVQRGVPAERTIVAGFSQGAAMALHVGLRYPQRLAGLVALSGYLVLSTTLHEQKSAVNQDLSIFMAHGAHDPTVPEALGAYARDRLLAEGYPVEWRTYPMGHSVCAEEIADLNGWLAPRLEAPS